MFTVLIIGIEILLGFLLQTAVFPHLSIAEIVPDILMIITVAVGYQKGHLQGMTTGLVAGLLLDIAFGEVLGVYALFYLLIGYCNGFLNKYYVENDLFLPMGMVAVSEFILSFAVYVFRFLVRGRLDIFYYIRRIMIPNVLYTVIVAILIYKLLDYVYIRILSDREGQNERI